MTTEQTPLAFIYDRHVTQTEVILELRLKACARYVSEHGWGFGGWWIDKGDCALTDDHRPAYDTLLRTMQAADASRPRVCLIYDWARLSRDMKARGLLTRRVLLLGGWVETCSGERRAPGDSGRSPGRLTSGPITA